MQALIIGVTYNPSQNSLGHLFFFFHFLFQSYEALLHRVVKTPIMTGINNKLFVSRYHSKIGAPKEVLLLVQFFKVR